MSKELAMKDDMFAMAETLIKAYEGCELKPYADTGGVPTIGWGNTRYEDGTAVTLDDEPLVQAQADALFDYWLKNFGYKVKSYASWGEDNELAAFISLAYNIGLEAFTSSSALRAFRVPNKKAAGDGIEMWNKAAGRILKGLQRRRRAERLVFDGLAPAAAIKQAEEDFA